MKAFELLGLGDGKKEKYDKIDVEAEDDDGVVLEKDDDDEDDEEEDDDEEESNQALHRPQHRVAHPVSDGQLVRVEQCAFE